MATLYLAKENMIHILRSLDQYPEQMTLAFHMDMSV